ncbi:hypothetical protein PR048_010389 [Dryococelus australis]|uniref:Uncharacterized protein n=1 Tax=Dryococelus australis TaxID=614101 RepID=A0ABQ9I2J4_9NEOP|nr:hypothetical protein PR048_010389 [Dryococelus australis]
MTTNLTTSASSRKDVLASLPLLRRSVTWAPKLAPHGRLAAGRFLAHASLYSADWSHLASHPRLLTRPDTGAPTSSCDTGLPKTAWRWRLNTDSGTRTARDHLTCATSRKRRPADTKRWHISSDDGTERKFGGVGVFAKPSGVVIISPCRLSEAQRKSRLARDWAEELCVAPNPHPSPCDTPKAPPFLVELSGPHPAPPPPPNSPSCCGWSLQAKARQSDLGQPSRCCRITNSGGLSAGAGKEVYKPGAMVALVATLPATPKALPVSCQTRGPPVMVLLQPRRVRRGESFIETSSSRGNRIRLERASQKQSSGTHKTPYDQVKRCRERKIINIKASERVNVDVFMQNKRPYEDLRLDDLTFFRYFRMLKLSFDELLVCIKDKILKVDSTLRKAIPFELVLLTRSFGIRREGDYTATKSFASVLRFDKRESVITVQCNFRRQYVTAPPTAPNVRRWHEHHDDDSFGNSRGKGILNKAGRRSINEASSGPVDRVRRREGAAAETSLSETETNISGYAANWPDWMATSASGSYNVFVVGQLRQMSQDLPRENTRRMNAYMYDHIAACLRVVQHHTRGILQVLVPLKKNAWCGIIL